MNVVLFEAFPDPYRQSMTKYSSCLKSAVTPLLRPGESVSSYFPLVHVAPKVARYGSEYVIYPWMARRQTGEVNHIIDHAYGHLTQWTEPGRTVVTVHDMIALKTRRGFIQRYNLGGIRRAAHVICDSEATQREFIRLSGYPSERTIVIYLGVGEEFFSDPTGNPFDRLGIPPDRYVLHIGHTMAYKNIPGLLRIFSILTHSMGLGLRLLRVGGHFSPEQEQLARDLGVDDRILHLGYLPQNRLPDLYRCAELLLFPSLDEGFGFPILEAMASGLPVVASNRGSLPELAGEATLLVDPEDEPTMAQRVQDLLQNGPLRSRLQKAGRRRAREFTWEKTAQKTLNLYRRIHQENSDR